MKPHVIISFAVLLALLLPPAEVSSRRQQKSPFSTVEEIGADFASVPCRDNDRQRAVKALFEKAGAAPAQVAVEEYDKYVQNVVVVKKGETDEKLVVGAHYDKVPPGCGAIDNWTGVVALAHLYRTLRNARTKKTLVFVAFGKEEKGLVGSRAMVKSIKKEQLAQYCAMINIDSLGLAVPQVADNMSSGKLMKFTEELAKEMKMPFAHTRIEGASSDSVPFVERKIPAVSIHGLTWDWPGILHGSNDQAKKVNHESVYMGYRLALAMIVRLDGADCAAYR